MEFDSNNDLMRVTRREVAFARIGFIASGQTELAASLANHDRMVSLRDAEIVTGGMVALGVALGAAGLEAGRTTPPDNVLSRVNNAINGALVAIENAV